jgi:hypothetical protein
MIFLSGSTCYATDRVRQVAILDVTARNSETDDAEVFSLTHILKVSGLPYKIFTEVDSVTKFSVVIVSSKLENSTLINSEKDSLINYVNKGGALITTNMRDAYFNSLFGISAGTNSNTNYKLIFNTFLNSPIYRWIDDTLEKTIHLGKTTFTSVINTRSYILNGSISLAKFESGTDAVSKSNFGSGFAYALGFSFKNIILVNQQNRDFDANRSYSNDFEPGSDAIILFLKAIILDHISFSAYLHTSPFNSKNAVLVTHDVDATSAFDTMGYYADYEQQMGLSASYYITTHYINDGALSDFYNVFTIPKVQQLVSKGHVLGSHSVGHFTDFDNETIFPFGVLGNTTTSYLPYNQGNSNPTQNGTVLGETEVSKNLLQNNFSVPVKTFRPGYLCFNDKLINALDTLNYKFSTTFSANDVLTNFPYISKKDRVSYGRMSKVWEIPMTISDVIVSDPISVSNYPQRVLKWLDVVKRNGNNNAPTVLLIHPNRMFKLNAQQNFISGLPKNVFVSNLEEYGDYWAARDSIQFQTTLNSNTLTVIVPDKYLPLPQAISFIIDNGQQLNKIDIRAQSGSSLNALVANWNTNDKIVYFQNMPVLNVVEFSKDQLNKNLIMFPNPCVDRSILKIEMVAKYLNCEIYDAGGKLVEQQCAHDADHIMVANNGFSGLYFIKVITENGYYGTLKMIFK